MTDKHFETGSKVLFRDPAGAGEIVVFRDGQVGDTSDMGAEISDGARATLKAAVSKADSEPLASR